MLGEERAIAREIIVSLAYYIIDGLPRSVYTSPSRYTNCRLLLDHQKGSP